MSIYKILLKQFLKCLQFHIWVLELKLNWMPISRFHTEHNMPDKFTNAVIKHENTYVDKF